MKISKLNFWHLRFPLQERYGDANGLKSHRACVVIRVESNSGLVGWGESSGYRIRFAAWEEAKAICEGAEFRVASSLIDRIASQDLALAGGMDIAFWDLRGKQSGLSMTELLGGAYRDSQPAYASLQNVTEHADVVGAALQEAHRAIELGFRSLKMKVGWHPVDVDIGWINEVLGALPAGGRLALDANRAMDLHSARTLIGGIKQPQKLTWFEEPLTNSSLAAYIDLRRSVDVPIAGAESLKTDMIEQVVDQRAMDIINPDLAGHGGIERFRKLSTLADANGVRFIPHCFDGQLTRLATQHFLASRPDWPEAQAPYSSAPLECDLSRNPLRDEMIGEPLRPDDDGNIPIPLDPGLGVTVNDQLIDRFSIAHL